MGAMKQALADWIYDIASVLAADEHDREGCPAETQAEGYERVWRMDCRLWEAWERRGTAALARIGRRFGVQPPDGMPIGE